MDQILVELNDGRQAKLKKVIKDAEYNQWRVVIEYQNTIEYHKITDIQYIGG